MPRANNGEAVTFLEARGFQTQEERLLLRDMAAQHVPRGGVMLEIGGEFGASTVCLHTGQPEAHLVTLDLFPDDLLRAHLAELGRAGVNGGTVQVRGDSRMVGRWWRTPLHLLFVDGGHHYPVVSSDCAFFPLHLLPGGVVLFHDYHGTHPQHAEVRRAVDEWYDGAQAAFDEIPGADSIRAFVRLRL